jgi:hypothetical protein
VEVQPVLLDRAEIEVAFLTDRHFVPPPGDVVIHFNCETRKLRVDGEPDVPHGWLAPDDMPPGPRGVIMAAAKAGNSVLTEDPTAEPSQVCFAALAEIITRQYGIGSFLDSLDRAWDLTLPENERVAALRWLARHGFARPVHRRLFESIVKERSAMGDIPPTRRTNWFENDPPGTTSLESLIETSLLISLHELKASSTCSMYA